MVSEFNSQKLKFWSFVSMVLLVFLHGYNLNIGYLQPWTLPGEQLTATSFTEYWLANGIFRFRIPMLFIISGYLFAMNDHRSYKERVRKRTRSLLFPYLIWSAVGLLLTYVLELFSGSRDIVAASQLLHADNNRIFLHQFQWYEILGSWIFSPTSYQLWFLRVLFIYNLMYPALRWCVTHRIGTWIFFTVATLFWLSAGGLVLIEGEGLLFFSLGIWIQKTNFNIDNPGKWLQPKYWASVFILFSITKTVLAFNYYFNGIEPVLLLMHKIVVFSGLITAWYGGNWLVKFLMNKKWFAWLSAFSFMIYVMHAPGIVYATKTVFAYMTHFTGYRMATFVLLPMCIITLTITLSALLRRYLPGVYSVVTGGRGFRGV